MANKNTFFIAFFSVLWVQTYGSLALTKVIIWRSHQVIITYKLTCSTEFCRCYVYGKWLATSLMARFIAAFRDPSPPKAKTRRRSLFMEALSAFVPLT